MNNRNLVKNNIDTLESTSGRELMTLLTDSITQFFSNKSTLDEFGKVYKEILRRLILLDTLNK